MTQVDTFAISDASMVDFAKLIEFLPAEKKEFASSLGAYYKKYGRLSDKQAYWVGRLIEIAVTDPVISQQKKTIASPPELGRVFALFDEAKKKLKWPKIVISKCGFTFRLSMAGNTAKFPGSITILTYHKFWMGRLHRDGSFDLSKDAGEEVAKVLESLILEFAKDPVQVVKMHGKFTGRCCFCNTSLTNEKSLSVGYGMVCAENFGLPWKEVTC